VDCGTGVFLSCGVGRGVLIVVTCVWRGVGLTVCVCFGVLVVKTFEFAGSVFVTSVFVVSVFELPVTAISLFVLSVFESAKVGSGEISGEISTDGETSGVGGGLSTAI
jgi:hypothetical protein